MILNHEYLSTKLREGVYIKTNPLLAHRCSRVVIAHLLLYGPMECVTYAHDFLKVIGTALTDITMLRQVECAT
jgi:hypothetical protein